MTALLVLLAITSCYTLGLALIAGLVTLAGNLYDRWIEADRLRAYQIRRRLDTTRRNRR